MNKQLTYLNMTGSKTGNELGFDVYLRFRDILFWKNSTNALCSRSFYWKDTQLDHLTTPYYPDRGWRKNFISAKSFVKVNG
jgi:hypothetical protein